MMSSSFGLEGGVEADAASVACMEEDTTISHDGLHCKLLYIMK